MSILLQEMFGGEASSGGENELDQFTQAGVSKAHPAMEFFSVGLKNSVFFFLSGNQWNYAISFYLFISTFLPHPNKA